MEVVKTRTRRTSSSTKILGTKDIIIFSSDYNTFQSEDRTTWKFQHIHSILTQKKPLSHPGEICLVHVRQSIQSDDMDMIMTRMNDDNNMITMHSNNIGGTNILSFRNLQDYIMKNSLISVPGKNIIIQKSLPDVKIVSPDSDMMTNVNQEVMLIQSSRIHVLYKKYKVVVSIDVSPSMTQMNPDGGVLFDKVYHVIHHVVKSLATVIKLSDTFEFIPDIRLTIIAVGSSDRPICTLFQNLELNVDNVEEVLEEIFIRIDDVENSAALAFRKTMNDRQYVLFLL